MRSDFVELIVNEIKKRKDVKYFRIHESGDWYCQEYLNKWFEICRRLPDIKFTAYTKSFHLDYSQKPDNLVIYFSVMPDTKMENIPEGPRAYLECGPENIHLCHGKCDECLYCWEVGKDIRLKKH
jgi:hypothetical protein